MFIDEVEVSRGVTIEKGGRTESARFKLVAKGVDGDWDKAHQKTLGIAEQLISDWLEKMEAEKSGLTPLPVLEPPEPAVPSIRPVQLVFNATGSRERSQRIMRAMSERMTFTPDDGDVWVCKTETRVFRVIAEFKLGAGYCNCEDFLHRGEKYQMPCKHVYALTLEKGEFWDKTMDIPVPRPDNRQPPK
jgi:predicted nucleic acid-binding Zn finger protein